MITFLVLGALITPSVSKYENHLYCEEKWIQFIHEYKKGKCTYDILQSRDGCYILLTYYGNLGAGQWDIHLICLDRSGSVKWGKVYGSNRDDIPSHIEQTLDNGFIIVGGTKSYGAGDGDVWLIKTDENGNEIWNKTYGGQYEDLGYYVEQTRDGGYIISGHTMSYSWEHYVPIGWLIKTDENGNEEWNKTIGGRATYVQPWCVHQTDDGGYLIIATLYHLVHPNPNEWVTTCSDIWLIKMDENGNEVWNKTYNYSQFDIAFDVTLTKNGGCAMIGVKWNITGLECYPIMHVIKVDKNGNVEWRRTFKGSESPETFGSSIQPTADGGYIVAGENIGADSIIQFSPERFWLIKLDENGNEEWNRSYQVIGCNLKGPRIIVKQTMEGGYIVAGTLWDGDHWITNPATISPEGAIVVKTDGMGRTKDLQLKLYMFTHLYLFVKQRTYIYYLYYKELFHGKHSCKNSALSQSPTGYSLIPDKLVLPIHFCG